MKSMARLEPGSFRERKVLFSAATVGAFFLILDQVTKLAITALVPLHSRKPVIPGVFDITHVLNPGAAWGILHGQSTLLLLISLTVFILISFFVKQICDGWVERYYALMLVLSGTLGNAIDRLFRHEVVDFLRFHIKDAYEWPSFNVADSCISVGVVIFILSTFLRPEEKKIPHDEQVHTPPSP